MSKKKKGTKKGHIDQRPTFQPVVYVTNKVATMITMLDSPEPKLLLRVIGTLRKAAVEKESNLEFMLSCGLYGKLMLLLESSDIYTLRFTLSLIQKVFDNAMFLCNLEMCELLTTAELVKKHYLTSNDRLIRTLCADILLRSAKYHSMISDRIYCTEMLEKIFEVLKTETNLELAENNLELFYYVINSYRAEEELLKCKGFSIASVLCFLETNYESLKLLASSILYKLAMWNRSDVLIALGNAKVIEAMARVLFSEPHQYYDKAFETMYACLAEDVCSREFVKTVEFVKLLEWMKICPRGMAGHSSLLLKCLSQKEELLQVLFDFSAEETAISLFRSINETVILNICDVIQHMMRHKYCCEKMAKPSLITILVEIVNENEAFSMIPYGEKALNTLYKFFQCYVETPRIVYESNTINMLINIFCIAKERMTREGYTEIIEIMQYMARSEYSEKLSNIDMYQSIIDLYRDSTFEEDKLLNIMESFLDCDEFRELILDRGVLLMMMKKIKLGHDSDCGEHTLVMLKRLIAYKKIGTFLIEYGYLAELKYFKENLKFNTSIVDQIIDALYDFSLTEKFFHRKKLYENDKIRDDFILIPDAITAKPLEAFNVKASSLSSYIPIYVVSYKELMYGDKEQKQDVLENDPVDVSASRRMGKRKSELSPFHYLFVSSLKIDKGSQMFFNTPSVTEIQESSLGRAIEEIYDEFHSTNPSCYTKRYYRIRYIAKYINALLSGKQQGLFFDKHTGKRHAFMYHLRQLIEKLNTNFVPIGYLKMGFQCERALLFKVLCDQTRVPVTLCKEGDCYFNEVTLLSGNSSVGNVKLVHRIFIVDLMENIGELIPANCIEAKMYLQRNRTKF